MRQADWADMSVGRRAVLVWTAAEGLCARVKLHMALDANHRFISNLP